MTTPATIPEHRRRGPVFWLSALAGWAIIGYGLFGLFHHHIDTRPTNLARFVVAGAIIHDLAFAPLILLLGVALSRAITGPARTIVQTGLFISGCLALFSYPLIRNYARILHNPTSNPHNYSANLALVLAPVWIVTTAVILVARRRQHRSRPNLPASD